MPIKLLTILGMTAMALTSNVSAASTEQLLTSAKVDMAKDVATLPLHLGYMKDGRKVWFVLTDTTDKNAAKRMGLVHASQLLAVAQAKSTRTAHIDANGTFTFDAGTVDFKPARQLQPGDAPNFFPPKSFSPGSVGDANYSPFVRDVATNIIYNAPIVAFDVEASQISFCDGNVDYSLVHDRVKSICPERGQISIGLGHGYASGHEVIYLSFDSNNALPATMEAATFTPATDDLKNIGASEALYAFANGATGATNPDRQGFNSALAGEGPPLNILDGLNLSSQGYTPLWDVNVAVWTADAIANGNRHRLTSGDQVDSAQQSMLLTNPMGAAVGSLGLLVNCPVIGFVN